MESKAKKQRTTRKPGRKAKEISVGMSRPRTAITSHSLSTASIDIEAYPHLLSSIIHHSSSGTRAALLLCSKALHVFTLKALYEHVRIDAYHLEAALKARMPRTVDPKQQSAIPDGFLTTRSLHLVEPSRVNHFTGDLARPEGYLSSLSISSLTITPQADSISGRTFWPNTSNTWYNISVAGGYLAHFTATQVYIRRPTNTGPQVVYKLGAAAPSVRGLTFLISFMADLPVTQICHLKTSRPATGIHIESASVLLPCDIHTHKIADWPSTRPHRERPRPEVGLGDRTTTRFVGAEYFAISPSQMATFRDNLSLISGTPADNIVMITFKDWLDEQEPGMVFTAEEEEALRKADAELRAKLPKD